MRQLRVAAAGRQVHWIAVDCLAATVLMVLLAGQAASRQPQFGIPAWLAIAATAVSALLIAVRRVRPAAVFALVLAANTLAVVSGVSGGPAITVALAIYTVMALRPGRWAPAALIVALAVTVPAEVCEGLAAQPPTPWLVLEYLLTATTVLIAGGWAAGVMQRRHAAYSSSELARHVVTQERLRIARELHDVVSNALTLITAKAAVTNYLTGSHPDDMHSALAVIEETGRGALTEMRRLLGALRADIDQLPAEGRPGEEASYSGPGIDLPAPGLAGLRALAAQATDAGTHTTVDIRGEREVPQALALPVYRIVQEALANVIKHAGPARCAVQVDLTGDPIIVDVTDDGHSRPVRPGRTGGHGLTGMRERAALYGGDVTAGPRPEGGFRVTARLPAGTAVAGVRSDPA
jgi:signal transduction histidine kinase